MLRWLFGARRPPLLARDEPVKVIVGLGNPGTEYERTRHNVGWWVVDHLADVWRFDGWKKDGDARVTTGMVGTTKVRLIKPLTFMNLSGAVLRSYLRRPFWSASHDLLVIVDEVALPIGGFRVRARGSAGGHNGLKSIEAAVRTQDYARLRVGIGPDEEHRQVRNLSDFVLDDFSKRETQVIHDLYPTFVDVCETWISKGAEAAMNKFNAAGRRET